MSTQAVTMPKAVRVIPAKPEYSGKSNADFRPKRVAAYCRVSTDKEEQEHSFETQKEMYTDMIMMKPNWQMAGIYADEGITGTIAKKRPDFMRMIEDCRKGKIDMVITKSVSRFSRNNLDCLQYVRELKASKTEMYHSATVPSSDIGKVRTANLKSYRKKQK